MLAEPLAQHYQNAPAYDAFEHLCWVAFPDGSQGQLIAMLTAYLDESYNQPTKKDPNPQRVYTVGCWLSSVEKWSRFGKQWKSALRSKGLDYFHMNRFENRKGEYEDWSDPQRHAYFRRLKRIIKDNTVYGASLSVDCKAYDDVMTPELKREWGRTYYGFNVRLIMAQLGTWADDNDYQGKIHYVFAKLSGQGGELDKIFRACLRNPEVRKKFRLNSHWTYAFMKDEARLQAADVIAYEMNKRAVNMLTASRQYVRKSLDIFQLDRSRFAPLYMGREQIVKLVSLANN